ncbi:MAG: hypothetical protein RLZZ210_1084 [Pseudomonadota bacterium]|jgi:ribonuclease T2
MKINKVIAGSIIGISCLLLSASIFANNANNPNQCNIPQNLSKPKLDKVDCQNKANVDYYLLALSWSPQFCYERRGQSNADVKMQCQDNKFGFIVHGLWPQKTGAKNKCEQPRNCNSTTLVSNDIIKQNLCIIPSVSLIQNEWQKHGSCAFSTPDDYYKTTKKLWDNLKKPDLISLQNSKKDLTIGDIQKAFTSINPKLTANNLSIETVGGGKSRYLKEVRICYDISLNNYKECEKKGAPPHLGVKIAEIPN